VETVIKIWQSRQTAECELASINQKTPIPNYKEPTHLFNPASADLPPHSEMEMETVVHSAAVLAPVRAQKVSNSSTTKRKLKPRIAAVVTEVPLPDTLESSTVSVPPVVQVTDLSDVVDTSQEALQQDIVEHKSRFKPPKKLPKRKAGWTPDQKFANAVAKKAYTHWRDKAKELPKTKAKTSVISLLNMHTPYEPPLRRQESKPNQGPRVPCQPTLKSSPSVEGGAKTGSSAQLTALHSPVRGHDPSARGWHLSRINSFLVVFVFAVLAHDRFTGLV
jgi:hypothetical protein